MSNEIVLWVTYDAAGDLGILVKENGIVVANLGSCMAPAFCDFLLHHINEDAGKTLCHTMEFGESEWTVEYPLSVSS